MQNMLPVDRREYKVILNHRLFTERKSAAATFWDELKMCAVRLKGVQCNGEFNKNRKRQIVFLDTRDHTILLNRLIFRARTDADGRHTTEYTLKCRSPDRYVAAGSDLKEGEGFQPCAKFEEDIGAPFTVRFSHSNTVAGHPNLPTTLGEASQIFPALARLKRDGEVCHGDVRLRPVNALNIFERVLKGPKLRFNDTEAEVALILWSDGVAGRPLVAEMSFRYGQKKEAYSAKTARKAMELFEELQHMDWCLPDARTKTEFIHS